jgi:hypothetical protein
VWWKIRKELEGSYWLLAWVASIAAATVACSASQNAGLALLAFAGVLGFFYALEQITAAKPPT